MMLKKQLLYVGAAFTFLCSCNEAYVKPNVQIEEVPFTQVHLNDNFWSPRIETNRLVSIQSAFY